MIGISCFENVLEHKTKKLSCQLLGSCIIWCWWIII